MKAAAQWLIERRPKRWWHWMCAIAAFYVLVGAYIVPPQQRAVVQCFGKVVADRVPPGLHWSPPWPVGRVRRVKVMETRRVTIGMGLETEVLKTSAPSAVSQFLTGDENIINVVMVVQYYVDDPAAYLFRTVDVDALVAAATSKALTRTLAENNVDAPLVTGKIAIQERVLRDASQTVRQQYGLGVHLRSTNITVAAPPPEVADAFRAVADAREDRARIVNLAETYARDLIPKAEGEAEKLLREAEAYQQETIQKAKGEAQRFAALVREYKRAPGVTRRRLQIEMTEEVLPKMRLVIVEDNGGRRPLDLGLLRREQE